jgi:hypothetical protein
MSVFAKLSRGKGESEEESLPFDEAKMEKAMAMMASEADRIDENDPRQAAKLMRKLNRRGGHEPGAGHGRGPQQDGAGRRPGSHRTGNGDLLEGEEPFLFEGKKTRGKRREKPRVDETLYDLE